MSLVRVFAAISVAAALSACSPSGNEKSEDAPEAAGEGSVGAPEEAATDDAAKPDEGPASAEAAKPEDSAGPAPVAPDKPE
jgi:hypothetical protein